MTIDLSGANNIKNLTKTVYAVIVTYDDRFLYVKRIANAILQSSIGKIVIVVNKTTPEMLESLREMESKTEKIEIIYKVDNLGSAIGFGMGIKLALSHRDCDFIWLLDDDTLSEPAMLQILLNKWQNLSQIHNPSDFV